MKTAANIQETAEDIYAEAQQINEDRMKYVIKHDIRGRMRIHVLQKRMTDQQAEE